MDSVTSVLVAAVVVVLAVWLRRQGRPYGFPPGPRCLPVLGNVLSMSGQPLYLQVNAWREKYGDIFSLSFGTHHAVVLNGYEIIKDALVQRGVEFAGRVGADNKRMRHYTPNYPTFGIGLNPYTEEWRRQRSATLGFMRSLGYGKSQLEEQMQAEAVALREGLAATESKPTNPETLLALSTANVMCSLMYGERYDHSDQEFQKFMHLTENVFKYWLADLECDYIWLLSFKPSYKKILQNLDNVFRSLNEFNGAKIDERRARLEREGYSDPRDFIENYLCELHKEDSSMLTEYWLPGIVNDMILAGTDTSAVTLNWACLWMAARPDVQHKVSEEVSSVLEANNGEISLSLREQCPYAEATIMEMMRITPIVPLPLTRATTSDVDFHGYLIPKQTEVFMNFHSVLMDPEAWPEPDQFRPERFLKEGHVVQNERWIPFSMGRRSCLGVQLGKEELFIFFTTIVAFFQIRFPEGNVANFEPCAKGLIVKPYPYEVIFEPRQ